MSARAKTEGTAPAGAHVVTGELHRVRRGRSKGFAAAPLQTAPDPTLPRRPARVAIMLALAWKIQRAIDRGEVRDRAEVARRVGMTRARVTQLLELTTLAPEDQERVLFLEAGGWDEPTTERAVRIAPCKRR